MHWSYYIIKKAWFFFFFPKVVIVGNGAVGKSSLIQKYCKGIFTTEYKKTIGVDFLERRIRLGFYTFVKLKLAWSPDRKNG